MAASSFAEYEGFHVCRFCESLPEDGTSGLGIRQYTPDRRVDIEHVLIDVTPDFGRRTVRGSVTIRFKPIAIPLKQLELHAVDLTIHEVTGSQKVAGHSEAKEELRITFEKSIPAGRLVGVFMRPILQRSFASPACHFLAGTAAATAGCARVRPRRHSALHSQNDGRRRRGSGRSIPQGIDR